MHDTDLGIKKKRGRIRAALCSLIYFVLAMLWILLSGKALDFLTNLADIRTDLEVYKGLLFVLLTSLALYALLRSWQNEMPNPVEAAKQTFRPLAFELKLPIIYLFGLIFIVASGGFVVYENLKNSELRKMEQNLAAIAKLKSERISGWINQNLYFAAAIGNGSYLASSFDLWMRQGTLSPERMQWLHGRIASLQQSYPYGELSLIDLAGKTHLMSRSDLPAHEKGHVLPLIEKAVKTKRPVISPVHWHDRLNQPRIISLAMAAPLMPSGPDGSVPGVILLEMNPARFLYPIIEVWPTPSKTAETLIFHHDGTTVTFLNELRHRKGMILSTFRIDEHPTLVTAQAAKGRIGLISGTDYRNEAVIGYVCPIDGTDWMMVAKVDAAEIYQPIRRIAINVGAVAILLALVGCLSLFFWWRQRRAQYETAQMAAELQQQRLKKQLDILSKHAQRHHIAHGYAWRHPRRKRSGRDSVWIYASGIAWHAHAGLACEEWTEDDADFQRVIRESSEKGMLFESAHRRRNGSVFPVEVSARLIEGENGNFIQSIIRDVSERKQAEDGLRLAATVFENSHGSIIITDERARIIAVNPAFTQITGYSSREVVGKNSAYPEFQQAFPGVLSRVLGIAGVKRKLAG